MELNSNPNKHEKHWYVIYTKSRHEKKVAELLTKYNIENYCPLKTERNQWKDRKKTIQKPLFNSYCFVRLNETELNSVYAVQGVVRFVYWCGKHAIVKDHEIETIKKWLNDFEDAEIEIHYFEKNEAVRINSGAFMGKTARVFKQNGNCLILILEELGLKLSVKASNIKLDKAV